MERPSWENVNLGSGIYEKAAATGEKKEAKKALETLLSDNGIKEAFFPIGDRKYNKYAKLAEKVCEKGKYLDITYLQKTIVGGAEAMGEDKEKAYTTFLTKCNELRGAENAWKVIGGARKTRRSRKNRKNKRRATRYRRR